MSESSTVTTTITPHLVCADALRAIEFYQQAFNAMEVVKLIGPTGKLVHGAMEKAFGGGAPC